MDKDNTMETVTDKERSMMVTWRTKAFDQMKAVPFYMNYYTCNY